MSDIERDFYAVTGGAVKDAYERWKSQREALHQARQNFAREFNADGWYGNNSGIQGLVFEGVNGVPDGWKKVRGVTNTYRPSGSSKVMKSLRGRMQALPLADAREFQDEVLGKPSFLHFMEGLSIAWMGFEFIGDTLILRVPHTSKGEFTPPDDQCRPIKKSEYWALKETHEASAGGQS